MVIKIAGGTIAGTNHTFPGMPGCRNNQDAYTFYQENNIILGIVTDGCGSSANSEVGAKLAVEILKKIIISNLVMLKYENIFWDMVNSELYDSLERIVEASTNDKKNFVLDKLLFTVVGFLIVNENVYTFSCGDGTFVFDWGDHISLEVINQDNSPSYFAYNLLKSSLHKKDPDSLLIKVQSSYLLKDIKALLIGTDGVDYFIDNEDSLGSISQFWEEDKYFKNKDSIRRKLAIINNDKCEIIDNRIHRHIGPLKDDITLVVMKNENFYK